MYVLVIVRFCTQRGELGDRESARNSTAFKVDDIFVTD